MFSTEGGREAEIRRLSAHDMATVNNLLDIIVRVPYAKQT